MADLPPPDDDEDFDPEQAERDVLAFIEAAEALDGPPVAELAADVARAVAEAWDVAERRTAGIATNKLIATMLLVGRQARQAGADEPLQWQLHAASTLLSGLIGGRRPGA